MMNRALMLVGFCALVAVPLGAVAAESPSQAPLKPIRTLSYDLSMSVGLTRESHTSGFNQGGPLDITGAGSGRSTSSGGYEVKGTIAVEVLAATQDKGLLVDVAESATTRNRPKTRVAIFSDGRLSYDPKQADNVSEEEASLLRWLARGFSADHDPGTAWDERSSNGPVKSTEHYRVLSAAGDDVSLDYKLEEKAGGAQGFDATRLGTVVYDTKLNVPRKVNYRGETRATRLGTYEKTESSISLALTADSFAKK